MVLKQKIMSDISVCVQKTAKIHLLYLKIKTYIIVFECESKDTF